MEMEEPIQPMMPAVESLVEQAAEMSGVPMDPILWVLKKIQKKRTPTECPSVQQFSQLKRAYSWRIMAWC